MNVEQYQMAADPHNNNNNKQTFQNAKLTLKVAQASTRLVETPPVNTACVDG